MRNYISLFIVVLLFNSCFKNDNPTETLVSNELPPETEFFPLAVDNFWEYEEHLTFIDTSFTRNFTLTVTDTEYIGNFKWFRIERSGTEWTEIRHLTSENDSVYELQYNWTYPIRSLQYFIPAEKVHIFDTIHGGDVMVSRKVERLDTIITTRIGSFNNCFKYEYSSPDYSIVEILAFGVGIVEIKTTYYNFINGKQTGLRISKIINTKNYSIP